MFQNKQNIRIFFLALAIFVTCFALVRVSQAQLVGGGDGTIGQLDQWKSDGTNITQRVASKSIKITGLSDGCLYLLSGVLTTNVTNLTCTGGGGGSGSGTVSTTTPLVSGQVDFSTGVSTIGNDSTFLFDTVSKRLTFQYSSSTAYSSFITASTTNLIINGQSFNNLLGTGLSNVGGSLTNAGVISLGNGTGATCSGTNPGTCNVNTTQNITNLSNLSSNGFVYTAGSNGGLNTIASSSVKLSWFSNDVPFVTSLTVASSNGFAGSFTSGATPQLTISTTINSAVLKGNGTAISGAVNGTDYTLITANTCSAGNHVSAITAAGVISCTADTGTGGFAFPFDIATHWQQTTAGTSTALWLQGTPFSLFASSTSVFTNSTSSQLTVTGKTWLTGLGSAGGLYADVNGLVSAGATTTAGTGLTYSGNAFNCNTASASVFGCLLASDFSKFNSATTTFGSGFATSTTVNGGLTLSTTTLTKNGQTFGLTIVPLAGSINFTPTLTGTLDNSGLTNSSFSTALTCITGSASVALGGTLTLSTTNSFACGGTGSTAFSPNSIITSNSAGNALIATGTQLTVGNIIATTTAVNIFGGVLVAPDGTLGSPSFSFADDQNNGIYSPANDVFAIETNGLERFRIHDGTGSSGFGTTTFSQTLLTLGTSTASQLMLSTNTIGLAQWGFRNAGGTFYLATTTTDGTATSSATSAISITSQGALTVPSLGGAVGCIQATAVGLLSNTGTACGTGGSGIADPFTHSNQYPFNSATTSKIAIGTTTPYYSFTVASTTGAQLALADGTSGILQWVMRNAGGNLFWATTTVAGTSTTTIAAFAINGNTGAVGIGDPTSDAKLEIVGTSGIGYMALTNLATNVDGDIFNCLSTGTCNVGTSTNSSGANLAISSSTKAQLALGAGTGFLQWVLRAETDGSLSWATTTVAGTATTSTDALNISGAIGSYGIAAGTTTPSASFAFNTVAGTDAMAIGSSTGTMFRLDKSGHAFFPQISKATAGTNQTTCYTSATGELVDETTTACAVSSRKFKNNIVPLDSVIDVNFVFDKLIPVAYSYNEDVPYDYKDNRDFGFIAEDVASADPHLAEYGVDKKARNLDDRALLSITALRLQSLIKEGVKTSKDRWPYILIGFLALWNVLITGYLIKRK